MRVTRRTNIIVKTERNFTVRSAATGESFFCEQCGNQMISVTKSANFFGFSSRIIYRLIESDSIHFVETETKEIYICPASVKKILKNIAI